jgi:NAD(P)-dependent dehydrogenase (short-subunit alcohol dehydrogenase family)
VAESIGPAATWLEADVDDPDDRARIVDAAVEHGGGIDVLVNNAGNRYAAPLGNLTRKRIVAQRWRRSRLALSIPGPARPP